MKFNELVNMRGDYGPITGDAKSVVKKFQEVPELEGRTENEIKRTYGMAEVVNRFRSDIEKAVKVLSDSVNSFDPKDVGEAIFFAMLHEHRTLQAQLWKAIYEAMRLYKDASYDGRNVAAVAAAEFIHEKCFADGPPDYDRVYIPLI